MSEVSFDVLVGKTLKKVENRGDLVTFTTTDGEVYRQVHYDSCCESVSVEDVCGDLADLVGTPILVAEESSSEEPPEDVKKVRENEEYYPDAEKWTFYKLSTIKGSVTIRWYGCSNGYYGVSVDFERVSDQEVA